MLVILFASAAQAHLTKLVSCSLPPERYLALFSYLLSNLVAGLEAARIRAAGLDKCKEMMASRSQGGKKERCYALEVFWCFGWVSQPFNFCFVEAGNDGLVSLSSYVADG